MAQTLPFFIPFSNRIEKLKILAEDLANIFTENLQRKVEARYLSNHEWSVINTDNHEEAIFLLSQVEAGYLEAYADFQVLFGLNRSVEKKVIIVEQNEGCRNLMDLRDCRITYPLCNHTVLPHPVTLFLKNNCQLQEKSGELYRGIDASLVAARAVLDKEVDAAVVSSVDYRLLDHKERQKLRILGTFPLHDQFICMIHKQLLGENGTVLKQKCRRWSKAAEDRLHDLALYYDDSNVLDTSMLREAVAGLGHTLKSFLKHQDELCRQANLNYQREQLDKIQEKYNRLAIFNEKLIQMYKEVRGSRDQLNEIIERATDRMILFMKDGTVIGASRAFSKLLQYPRLEIIGKPIMNIMEAKLNTPLDKLIQQVDFELLRSFYVTLQKKDGSRENFKMEFTLIELSGAKVIVGVISKKEHL